MNIKEFDKLIPEIEKTIGYSFKDKSLLRQAFTRTSFCNEAHPKQKLQSNEVLEFFGDGVLSASIITALIKKKSSRYEYGIKTELKEGDFSNIRSKLSDKKNLSENIERLGLQKYLLMGEGDIRMGVEREHSVMEDLFESIIGAVYIDSDYDIDSVSACLEVMLDITVYLEGNSHPPIQSYKNALQEWCADKKRRLPPPVYEKISESGPDHDKTYVVRCYIDGKPAGEGSARSIKLAQSAAAEDALRKIENKI